MRYFEISKGEGMTQAQLTVILAEQNPFLLLGWGLLAVLLVLEILRSLLNLVCALLWRALQLFLWGFTLLALITQNTTNLLLAACLLALFYLPPFLKAALI